MEDESLASRGDKAINRPWRRHYRGM